MARIERERMVTNYTTHGWQVPDPDDSRFSPRRNDE
jgi:hypothetical protein